MNSREILTESTGRGDRASGAGAQGTARIHMCMVTCSAASSETRESSAAARVAEGASAEGVAERL